MPAIFPNSDQEKTSLLRDIADHGLIWHVGLRSPNINYPPNGTKDIAPDIVAKLIEDDVLTVELCNERTLQPYLYYHLTRKGANMVLASFKGLGVHLMEPGALDENSFTKPDNEP